METPSTPHDHHHGHTEEAFSLPLFLFTVVTSLAGLVALLWLLAPNAVWTAQISTTVWRFLAAFLAIKMFNCFMEYGFHRYVLHKPVIPFLSRFYTQHSLHNNLTRIGRRRTPGGREVPFVENVFPVTTPEQGEASFFPWYTLVIFAAILTPLLAALQWAAPSFPWFLAGFAALAASLIVYEVFHAIEHWAFERWAPLIEHRQFGWFWRKVYSFHLRHHAVIDCNEAISGFFTLPVADVVFGTLILPRTLYVDGSEWKESDFESPRPCGLIRWCDQKSDALIKARRAEAGKPPATYTRGEQIAHRFTHSLGLALSVACLALLDVFAAIYGNVWHIVSFSVFGVSLVLLYTAFYGPTRQRARELFHKYAHAAIFLLIAGTATPFLLVNLRGPWGWSLFGAVWGLCLAGTISSLMLSGRLKAITTFSYLSLGLLALVSIKPMLSSLQELALWLILAGVMCYVLGTLFHLWQRLRYHQVMRHLCVFGGSACHLIAVFVCVLPMHG
jgi:hemolysin III